MKHVLFVFFALAQFSLSNSCDNRKLSGSDLLAEFCNIYDIEMINWQIKPLCDTLIMPGVTTDSLSLILIGHADCSVCIAETISFISAYMGMKNPPPLTIINASGDLLPLRHYLKEQFNGNPEKLSRAWEIIGSSFNVPPMSPAAEDGVYLEYNGRIVRYMKYGINENI